MVTIGEPLLKAKWCFWQAVGHMLSFST